MATKKPTKKELEQQEVGDAEIKQMLNDCDEPNKTEWYMTNKDEALKMAIEALEAWDGTIEYQYTGTREAMSYLTHIAQKTPAIINACKEALEQPAQELVAWTKSIDKALETLEFYVGSVDTSTLHPHVKLNYEDFLSIVKSIKQFKNSIVNTNREIMYFGLSSKNEWIKISKDTFDFRVNNKRKMKLYTHPTPSWVGLSDDEIDKEALKDDHAAYFALGALWANQALKEKNHD